MGTTKSRFDFSNVIQRPLDNNGLSNSSMMVVQRIDNYTANVYNSTNTNVYDIVFREYPSGGTFYINNSSIPQDIDICVVSSYTPCTTLINKVIDKATGQEIPLSKIYFNNPTTSCSSYPYRLGSVINEPNSEIAIKTGTRGELCKISVGDYKETSNKFSECCNLKHIDFKNINFNQDIKSMYNQFVDLSITQPKTCPITLSNGYSTNHCNDIMNTFCSLESNINSQQCIMYVLAQLQKGEPAIKPFIDYCSHHLDERVCSYMSLMARERGMSGISDAVLKSYCSNYPNSNSCRCYNTYISLPSNFSENAYMGPIACWYKPCAEETNQQFLLTEHLRQRSKCNVNICSIDVDNINLQSSNPSLVTLINDCKVSLQTGVDIKIKDNVFFQGPIWNPGRMGLLTISLSTIIIFIPSILSALK